MQPPPRCRNGWAYFRAGEVDKQLDANIEIEINSLKTTIMQVLAFRLA
jgi:hypothetical protein